MNNTEAISALNKVIKRAGNLKSLNEKRTFVIQAQSIVQDIFGIESVEMKGLTVFSDATYGVLSVDDVYSGIIESYIETLKSYIDTLNIKGEKKIESTIIEKQIKSNWFSHFTNAQIMSGMLGIYLLGMATVKGVYEIIDRSKNSTNIPPMLINTDTVTNSKTTHYADSGKDSTKYDKTINDSVKLITK